MTGWHVLAFVVVGTVLVYGAIDWAARRLFDHVDLPERDETAPPEDAP